MPCAARALFLAYYGCYSPEPVTLGVLVRVAGQRWKIEESFQAAKSQAGLDEHQVRRWRSQRIVLSAEGSALARRRAVYGVCNSSVVRCRRIA